MVVKIERANWTITLAAAIETAKDGDTIIAHDEAIKELAKRAVAWMYPDKKIQIEINEE